MNLILWRHAEAEDTSPDMERRLTAKGKRQARKLAEWLEAALPAKSRVVASEARRARETARALTDAYESVPELNPGAEPKAYLAAAGWPSSDDRTVVLVGHQDGIGAAAALAVTGRASSWRMKKGAIIWLESRKVSGKPEASIRAVLSPDLL
jgi:phosphohistidine phosphatase